MADKNIHFVVEAWYDDEGQLRVRIDDDTTDARFPDGCVWNNETDEWEYDEALADKAHAEITSAFRESNIWNEIQ